MEKNQKKDNAFVRFGKKIAKICKDTVGELKKVVWSTPKQVLKNALIVVGCVLVVGLFIWVFDLVAETLVNGLIGLFH